MIILPRQARDKHRESTQNSAVVMQMSTLIYTDVFNVAPAALGTEPSFFAPFETKKRSFYQYRLGINIGKQTTQKKRGVFVFLQGSISHCPLHSTRSEPR